jgi:hypothetical protein
MITGKKQNALFPDIPRDSKLVDENGEITPLWKKYFEDNTQALQSNYSPEGLAAPQQSASNIALLTGTQSTGRILYDSTNNLFKGNVIVGGVNVWKTFTLT